ncbi:MAG: AGE family epimerase/isomerase [Planctomycetota bacterium]|nr:AGE family epimerase/isomerase [Planctomycetota bacterium]
MPNQLAVMSLVIVSCLSAGLSAKDAETPRIISWSNSKTADSKWGGEDRFKGRGAYLILVWKAKNLTVENIHDASYMGRTVAICPSGISTRARNRNIHIRNITSEHSGISLADSDDVFVLNNIILGCPWNWGLYGDHGLANTHIVGNRVINGGANACLIVDVNPYWEVRDNLFQGTWGGIDISQGPSHVIIENNTIVGARDFGIMIKPQKPGVNVTIAHNCIYDIGNWKGGTPYGYGILATEYQNSHGESRVRIINNTIYNCAGDGIHNSSESAVFRHSRGLTPAAGRVVLNVCNNIITNCKGYGINHSFEGGKTTISYNDVWNNTQGNYKGCSAGPGDFSKDPLFVNPSKGDFHLRSKSGRWNPKAKKWVKDDVHSPCIDAGDPNVDFSLETEPNGERVNIGAYGGTIKASKSAKQQKGNTGEIMNTKKQSNPQYQVLAKRLEEHLEKNILSFLLRYSPDAECGGFVTQLDRKGKWYGKRTKRLVPQTRMVWTFSSAHRAGLGGGRYLQAARDGFPFLIKYMWDGKEGGWYWSVTRKGKPGSMRKSIYAQAFGIYGPCEYYFASGDKEALRKAEETYNLLEKHAYDKKNGGYFTCDFTRDWKKQGSGERSAGTHLHLVESVVSLVRATGKEKYRKRLRELLDILTDRMFLPEYGCNVEVYTEDWKPIIESNTLYVHDLEAAWLIIDAARALGLKDEKYLHRACNLVDYSIKHAWDEKHGGFFQKGAPGKPADDTKKNYNTQGEGLVSLATLYRETGDNKYFRKLKEHARWCLEVQADSEFGEWFTMCTAGGKPTMIEKAGLWKAGYHHPRGCLYAAKILDGIKK